LLSFAHALNIDIPIPSLFYLTLRVLRNALDGVDINTGIGTADEAGNCLTEGEDYRYSEEERSYYALNIAFTS